MKIDTLLQGRTTESLRLNEYQQLVRRTLNSEEVVVSKAQLMILWNAVGLAGEIGEYLELVKKGIFHKHGLDREKVKKELGDILWYLTASCQSNQMALADVAEANIRKLEARLPDGWDGEGRNREGGAA